MILQPEALRLAEILERPGYGWHTTPAQCAAELRRLSAVEAERDNLRHELDQLKRDHDSQGGMLALVKQRRDELEVEAQNSHEAWVALSAHADKLRAENDALRRGECICKRCGLRQPGEAAGPVPF